MFIKLKVNILKDDSTPIMGPGPLRLLEKIKKLKSINKAAKSMNLSYVKALNMLNRLEQNLSQKLLIRKRGGSDRGGTELTAYAEKYIRQYKALENNINRFAQSEFQSFLNEIEKVDENKHT